MLVSGSDDGCIGVSRRNLTLVVRASTDLSSFGILGKSTPSTSSKQICQSPLSPLQKPATKCTRVALTAIYMCGI